ncbi:MAG: glycosyltransferase [Lentimicrobiaceae bacterium]
MNQLLIIITILVAINYILLILLLTYGFKRLNNQWSSSKPGTVSIVIAARNEESNILSCLKSIALQEYPHELLDIIIVNDQSTDATASVINNYIDQNKELSIRQLITTDSGGKKAALRIGISYSIGELILTTDADCQLPKHWVAEMNRCFCSTDAVFIAGPVMMNESKQFFNHFQCLEFNSLIASTAGWIGIKNSIMCNGANMGFSRKAYDQLTGNAMNDNITSGDDIFLMFSMKRRFGANRIAFAKSPDACVYTSAQPTLKGFISQRIRWVSKSSSYQDLAVIYTALSVFAFNLLNCVLLTALLFRIELFPLAIGIFLLKNTVDAILLFAYTSIFGQQKHLWLLPIMELCVILYTVLIGVLGNLLSFKWKDRTNH